uniref:C2H2-type domain-containing protein n=1 Tax=Pundamilia nyererei TaxID=303518 RepID=A0A3B4F4S4_9CICH
KAPPLSMFLTFTLQWMHRRVAWVFPLSRLPTNEDLMLFSKLSVIICSLFQATFRIKMLKEFPDLHCVYGSSSRPCRHCGGGKAFRCDLCGKTFSYRRSLKVHQRRHTGDKMNYCKECGSGFPTSSALKKHELYHSGVKDHLCDQCGSSFTTADHLKDHKRVHTGEKPYKCRHCDKSFSRSSGCNRHERTHIEENFSCDQCDKSFKNFTSYSKHKRSHAANKLFHCYQCAKSFTSLSALCKHQRDHAGLKSLDHNESDETERSSSGFRVRLKHLEIRLHRVQLESPVKSVS